MTRNPINLPGISLTATADALFTVAQGVVVIEAIILTNTDVAARTVNLYVRRINDTADRRVLPKDHSLAAGMFVAFETPLTLTQGDSIKASASVASVVDCTISGYLQG